jgi:hypothetical protein
MAFRRHVLEQMGGFQSRIGRVGSYPAGCEETELCIRIKQRLPRSVILYEPAARVAQWVPAERASWSYFLRRCYAEGRSKALVSQMVGAQAALASERTYTQRTLPRGVSRGLELALRRRPAGAARAAAIATGLLATAAGYLSVAVAQWLEGTRGTLRQAPGRSTPRPAAPGAAGAEPGGAR